MPIQPAGRVTEPEIVRTRESVDVRSVQHLPAKLWCRCRPGDEIEAVFKVNGVAHSETLKLTADADDGESSGACLTLRGVPNANRSYVDPELPEELR